MLIDRFLKEEKEYFPKRRIHTAEEQSHAFITKVDQFLENENQKGLLRYFVNEKSATYNSLDRHLLSFERMLKERGSKVHWAKNDQEVQDIVREIDQVLHADQICYHNNYELIECNIPEIFEDQDIQPIQWESKLAKDMDLEVTNELMPLFGYSTKDIERRMQVQHQTFQEWNAQHIAQLNQEHEHKLLISGVTAAFCDTGKIMIHDFDGSLANTLPTVHTLILVVGIDQFFRRSNIQPIVEEVTLGMSWVQTGGFLEIGEKNLFDVKNTIVVLLDNGRTTLMQESQNRDLLHLFKQPYFSFWRKGESPGIFEKTEQPIQPGKSDHLLQSFFIEANRKLAFYNENTLDHKPISSFNVQRSLRNEFNKQRKNKRWNKMLLQWSKYAISGEKKDQKKMEELRKKWMK